MRGINKLMSMNYIKAIDRNISEKKSTVNFLQKHLL